MMVVVVQVVEVVIKMIMDENIQTLVEEEMETMLKRLMDVKDEVMKVKWYDYFTNKQCQLNLMKVMTSKLT